VTACFNHTTVPSGLHNDLIDHRYFYHDQPKEIGHSTCGLARDAVAHELLELRVDFADTAFLTSIGNHIGDKAVIGFLIENAVLSSIRTIGLAIGGDLAQPMELRTLKEPPDFEMDFWDTAVLYRPKPFNLEAIDGMIVLIESEENAKKNAKKNAKNKNAEPTKQKLFMFPIQITVAKAHDDSRVDFFEQYYHEWTKNLSSYDVVVEFLWITQILRKVVKYKKCEDWPAHTERYIPLMDVNLKIGRKYKDALDGAERDSAERDAKAKARLASMLASIKAGAESDANAKARLASTLANKIADALDGAMDGAKRDANAKAEVALTLANKIADALDGALDGAERDANAKAGLTSTLVNKIADALDGALDGAKRDAGAKAGLAPTLANALDGAMDGAERYAGAKAGLARTLARITADRRHRSRRTAKGR